MPKDPASADLRPVTNELTARGELEIVTRLVAERRSTAVPAQRPHGNLMQGDASQTLKNLGLSQQTPLWYYLLKEADVQRGGTQLGDVGGRIVAEVLIGLLQGTRAPT